MKDSSNRVPKYSSLLSIFKIKYLFLLIPTFGFIFFSSDNNSVLIQQYKEAKENKNCAVLKQLYSNKDFTLKDIAKIRFYKICTQDRSVDFVWNQFPKWLQRLALQAWFHRASKTDNKEDFIKASQTFSRFTPHYDEKTRYIVHAITVAKRIQSPKLPKLRKQLYQIAPSWMPNPPFSKYLKVAADYKKRNQFQSAIQYYRKVLNSKKATITMKHTCYQQLKWLYKATKQRNRYLKANKQHEIFQKKYMKSKFKTQYVKNQIRLARNYWTAHRSHSALNVLKALRNKAGAKLFLAEINWLIGKIYEEEKKYHVAMMYFEKAKTVTNRKTNPELYEKIIWSNVWNARKLGTFGKAIKFLNEFEKESPKLKPQFSYWKAQILEQQENIHSAKEEYKKLVNLVPFSFHGIISHYKLQKPLQLDLVAIPPKKKLPYTLIDDLVTAEEKELVIAFVKHLLESEKDFSSNKEHLLQIFLKSTNVGFYLPFFQFVGSLSNEEKSQFIKQYAYTLFPIIYQKEINRAEKLFNIPAEMIYSMIRQESAFNPRAISPANAVGLMQVLPSVARQTARRKGIAFRRVHDLYNPRTNILIGTAHLQDVFKKHGGSVIVNMAIYNAGHRPVKKWLKKFSTKDPIEFIQNIPYKETRLYVRLIIRNFILYQLLKDDDNQIEFPKWLLNLPQQPTA